MTPQSMRFQGWIPAAVVIVAVTLAASAVFAQGPATRPTEPVAFEVASVKPLGPVSGFAGGMRGCDGGFPKVEGNRSVVTTTPFALITWAYGYNKVWGCAFTSSGDLITGGPSWVRSERYEIQALAPDGAHAYTFDEFMKGDALGLEKMLQSLLADRFKMVVHHVTKEVPGYALVVGKGGPKLNPSGLKPSAADDKPMMGGRRTDKSSQTITARKMEMRDLAFLLVMTTNRPVIDRTGLTGQFNFDLNFAPLDSDTTDSSAPSLFTAIQEQLGLRLDTTKAPLDGLVIDSIERPGAN